MSGSALRWTEDQLAAYRQRRQGQRSLGNVEPVRIASDRRVTTAAIDAGYAPLVGMCRAAGVSEPVPEYQFAKHIGRRWAADYCWPLHKLILEVQGGIWTQGRHVRGAALIAEYEKLSEAAILGYRVLLCTPDELRNGVAMDRVIRALGAGKGAA